MPIEKDRNMTTQESEQAHSRNNDLHDWLFEVMTISDKPQACSLLSILSTMAEQEAIENTERESVEP